MWPVLSHESLILYIINTLLLENTAIIVGRLCNYCVAIIQENICFGISAC